VKNPIRVVIVDDAADILESVVRLLSKNDIEVVGTASDGRLAIEAVRTTKPDVVLMDITMPTMDGIAAAEVIRVEAPHTMIVMMSGRDEPELFRRAMLAGAREFLVKPFETEQLIAVIHQVAGRRQQDRTASIGPEQTANTDGGRVLTLFSPKGGVGRTTIACNLAVALRRATGSRVALVDASFQFGATGVMLGLASTKTVLDLVPHLAELDARLIGEVVMTHASGVDVLLGPPRPESAELVTAEVLTQVLTAMRHIYDFLVVDTPAALTEPVLSALDVADRIVLVLTGELPAVQVTRQFLELATRLGYRDEKMLLILNRAGSRGGMEVGDMERVLGLPVALRIPSDARLLTSAVNRGEPFVTLKPRAGVAKSMYRLAALASGRPSLAAPRGDRRRSGPAALLGRLIPFRRAPALATAD
jgi:pilus assembly protein CpaE